VSPVKPDGENLERGAYLAPTPSNLNQRINNSPQFNIARLASLDSDNSFNTEEYNEAIEDQRGYCSSAGERRHYSRSSSANSQQYNLNRSSSREAPVLQVPYNSIGEILNNQQTINTKARQVLKERIQSELVVQNRELSKIQPKQDKILTKIEHLERALLIGIGIYIAGWCLYLAGVIIHSATKATE
jgi:hypothetical protein